MSPPMATRLRRMTRRTPAVVACALVAHTVLYRSLWPTGAAHAYFAWYAPLVAALALGSIVVVPLLVAVALSGATAGRWLRVVAPPARRPLAHEATSLGAGALAVLLTQESVERSLQVHHAALVSLSPASWALVALAIASVTIAVAWAGRAVTSLAQSISRRRVAWRRQALLESPSRRPSPWLPQRQPLAVHGGLRAPPSTR